nr:uncharacterized protein LOC129380574 [Dermacentor andersoni]
MAATPQHGPGLMPQLPPLPHGMDHQAPPPMHPGAPPPPPPFMAAPPAPVEGPSQQQHQPSSYSKKLSLGGGSVRLQLNREYYRTVPGMLGIVEVLCSCAIVTTLSLRGFVFDVFFFLCNLGFTYALVGAMFFVNGLVGSRAGRDLPLLVAVQYYGLGFVMFLAAGIASLVKSQREALAIMVGTVAVIVAIALFVHAVYAVRTS